MTETPTHPRRRFRRFSLRGLMLLILVISVAFGWTIHKVRKQGIAVATFKKRGCELWYDDSGYLLSRIEQLRQLSGEVEPRNVIGMNVPSKITDADSASFRSLPHLEFLDLRRTQITDAGLVHLAGLTQLWELYLDETKVTDVGLVHLKGLSHLERLHLDRTPVTGAGLVHLRGLTQLRELHLDGTKLTDAGLANLRALTKLERLYLRNTNLTDAGLIYLQALVQLKQLHYYGSQVTYDGAQNFQKALPLCWIQGIEEMPMRKFMPDR